MCIYFFYTNNYINLFFASRLVVWYLLIVSQSVLQQFYVLHWQKEVTSLCEKLEWVEAFQNYLHLFCLVVYTLVGKASAPVGRTSTFVLLVIFYMYVNVSVYTYTSTSQKREKYRNETRSIVSSVYLGKLVLPGSRQA